MALEAVVYPKAISSYNCKDLFSLDGWNSDLGLKQEEENGFQQNHVFPCFSSENDSAPPPPTATTCTTTTTSRPKRRRTKKSKNKEEVEIQRMTHIAVERNRRKQMNEYLAVLQSLMPASYVKRSDQASIIGGAINFVKELEQFLQSLEARKRVKGSCKAAAPFADFFAFPHYTSCSSQREPISENGSSIADIEVTMVESHANLKILSKRRPRQILKMVVGLQTLRLTILHLNVTTVDAIGLYSFSVKVEDDCQLKSVDEIASAVHQMLHSIKEGAALN